MKMIRNLFLFTLIFFNINQSLSKSFENTDKLGISATNTDSFLNKELSTVLDEYDTVRAGLLLMPEGSTINDYYLLDFEAKANGYKNAYEYLVASKERSYKVLPSNENSSSNPIQEQIESSNFKNQLQNKENQLSTISSILAWLQLIFLFIALWYLFKKYQNYRDSKAKKRCPLCNKPISYENKIYRKAIDQEWISYTPRKGDIDFGPEGSGIWESSKPQDSRLMFVTKYEEKFKCNRCTHEWTERGYG